VAKVGNDATFDEPYGYAAVTDLYFASAFLPDVPDRASVVTLHNTIDLPGDLSDPNSRRSPRTCSDWLSATPAETLDCASCRSQAMDMLTPSMPPAPTARQTASRLSR
jgi:hypothetical protein